MFASGLPSHCMAMVRLQGMSASGPPNHRMAMVTATEDASAAKSMSFGLCTTVSLGSATISSVATISDVVGATISSVATISDLFGSAGVRR